MRERRAAVVLAAFFLLGLSSARGQALIKIDVTRYLKLGIYLKANADWTQLTNASKTETDGYQQNLYMRLARLLLGARVAPDVYFFLQTDNTRLGYATTASSKSLATGFQLVDALGEWRLDDAFILDAGLLRVPYSRVALTASSRVIFLDVSAYGFLQQTPTQSTSGNSDTGFLARGYLADHRLEYRLGVFSGVRLPGVHNPFRASGRLQWEFLERETLSAPEYVGPALLPISYLGAKKVLAFGAGFDTQMDYRYGSADLLASIPTGSLGSFEGILQYQYIDGGVTFPTLPLENTFGADLGYYVTSLKSALCLRVEQRTFNGQPEKNDWRAGVTLAYFRYGHNFNIKGAGIHVMPRTGPATNQFTIQLQLVYY